MNKFNLFLEKKLLPIASKLGANRVLIAIRNGITLSMPLIIIGSLFLIIGNFPIDAWIDWLGETGIIDYLNKGTNGSFGIMGLVASFGIAQSLASQHDVDGTSAGVIALSSFLVATPNIFSGGEAPVEGIPVAYMGSRGLFVAIVLGIITALIFAWFINHNIQITLPDSVPPAVSKSFSALIPGAAIITLWLVIFALLDATGIGNIHDLLLKIFGGPLGLLGATIGLVVVITIIALKKKSSQLTKTMAPLTLTPGIFNINEPAMYGLPVVLNISLIIPFILAPMVNALVTYFTMSSGLVARTVGIAVPWTMPPVISGFLATGGHMSGAILQVVLIILDILIYYPFYQTVERQNVLAESGTSNN